MIFFIIINAAQANAEERRDFSTGHGISLAVGGPALGGIAYRKFFENRLGFQTSFLAYPASTYFDMICSAHLFYTLNDKPEWLRFYVLIGGAAVIESLKKLLLAPGAGLGLQFSLNKNLSLALDLALAPIINISWRQHPLGFMPFPLLGLVLTYYI